MDGMIEVVNVGRYGLQDKLPGAADESLNNGISSQERELTAILDAHAHEMAKVQADHGLNAMGRTERLRRAQDAAVKALDEHEKRGARLLGTVQTDADVIRGRLAARLDFQPDKNGTGLVPRIAEADRAAAAVREREIRDRLLNLDATQRLAVGLTAATSNDLETLRAIAHAPASFPILDSASWKQVDDAHVQQHHAADTARLRELDNYVGTVNFNLNVARRRLQGGRGGRTPTRTDGGTLAMDKPAADRRPMRTDGLPLDAA